MSPTPAFSPGPWMTRGPFVGSRRRCTRDDLYEQCSLHITLKTPSSVYEGARPSSSSTRAYSSSLSLCLRMSAASMGGSFGRSAGGWNDFGRVGGEDGMREGS